MVLDREEWPRGGGVGRLTSTQSRSWVAAKGGRPEERPREPGWAAADDIEGWLGVDRGPPGGSGRGGNARAGQWRPRCRRRRGWAWAPTGRRRIGLKRQRACEACVCVCVRERERERVEGTCGST
jgi:hypothetical protein